MRVMRITVLVALLFVFCWPMNAMARDPDDVDKDKPSTSYLEQMQTFYGFDSEAIKDSDWIISIIMVAATFVVAFALVFLICLVVFRIILSVSGKVVLFDGQFWKRIGWSVFVLMALMSGLILTMAEKTYEMIFG